MSVLTKLQIKPGQAVAVLHSPPEVDLGISPHDLHDDPATADAAVLFVTSAADLSTPDADSVVDAAQRDALAWVAYPKAGQLGTDLNRDRLAALLVERNVRAVRQVSIDDVWSALRFRPL
ncbi:MAG: hypothetical protein M3314_07885 [Actinomycetota bacterium]|nr:hypothetical protein [Actinomycetota bacterium]